MADDEQPDTDPAHEKLNRHEPPAYQMPAADVEQRHAIREELNHERADRLLQLLGLIPREQEREGLRLVLDLARLEGAAVLRLQTCWMQSVRIAYWQGGVDSARDRDRIMEGEHDQDDQPAGRIILH